MSTYLIALYHLTIFIKYIFEYVSRAWILIVISNCCSLQFIQLHNTRILLHKGLRNACFHNSHLQVIALQSFIDRVARLGNYFTQCGPTDPVEVRQRLVTVAWNENLHAKVYLKTKNSALVF